MCIVEGCKGVKENVGAFCDDHWDSLPKERRKYLRSEWDMGERWGWHDWNRRIFDNTVATVARGLK